MLIGDRWPQRSRNHGTESRRDFQPAALLFGASPAFVGDCDRQLPPGPVPNAVPGHGYPLSLPKDGAVRRRCCGDTGTLKMQHPSSLVDAPLLGQVRFTLMEFLWLKREQTEQKRAKAPFHPQIWVCVQEPAEILFWLKQKTLPRALPLWSLAHSTLDWCCSAALYLNYLSSNCSAWF